MLHEPRVDSGITKGHRYKIWSAGACFEEFDFVDIRLMTVESRERAR
jgi:hypothetical protein